MTGNGDVMRKQVRTRYRRMRVRLLLIAIAGLPDGVLAVQWTVMTFLRQAHDTGRTGPLVFAGPVTTGTGDR
jgi:hypothetical protein